MKAPLKRSPGYIRFMKIPSQFKYDNFCFWNCLILSENCPLVKKTVSDSPKDEICHFGHVFFLNWPNLSTFNQPMDLNSFWSNIRPNLKNCLS